MILPPPDREELKRLLSYDPDTGIFRWRIKRGHIAAGMVAGTVMGNGYRIICLEGKRYLAHRLAYYLEYGTWPKLLNHINRNHDDNRIANLRPCTASQGQWNRGKTRRNKSGYKGVHWSKHHGRWLAQIVVNYKHIPLGCFDCPKAAYEAYKKAADKHHGEFASYE